jgi:hypothetical protein
MVTSGGAQIGLEQELPVQYNPLAYLKVGLRHAGRWRHSGIFGFELSIDSAWRLRRCVF